MKLPNFENWSSGELSKIGHHFSNFSKKDSDDFLTQKIDFESQIKKTFDYH